MNNEDFELYLRQGNMAENTINAIFMPSRSIIPGIGN